MDLICLVVALFAGEELLHVSALSLSIMCTTSVCLYLPLLPPAIPPFMHICRMTNSYFHLSNIPYPWVVWSQPTFHSQRSAST